MSNLGARLDELDLQDVACYFHPVHPVNPVHKLRQYSSMFGEIF